MGVLLGIQLSADKKADAHSVQAALVAGHSGKCLAVYPGHFHNGSIAYQWTCGGGDNVRIEDAGGGYHYIVFLHSGKCLTVNGYSPFDGGTLDQWDCVGQSNQRWTGTFFGGVFEVHASQANPSKCITVHGESVLNGAIVNQWQCVFRPNQGWLTRAAAPPMPTATPTRTATPTATPKPGDGELTITKDCDPDTDPGEFLIRISGVVQGQVGCGESIGPISLAAGTYRVSESAGPGTDLSNYNVSFNGDCDPDGDVVIVADQESECIIENDRD